LLTSEHPESHTVLSETGTPTTPSVLFPIVPELQHREHIPKGRVAATDLRIGLSMLGQEGRKLLAEYITIKLQQASKNTAQHEVRCALR
jgi:hypothetical protein